MSPEYEELGHVVLFGNPPSVQQYQRDNGAARPADTHIETDARSSVFIIGCPPAVSGSGYSVVVSRAFEPSEISPIYPPSGRNVGFLGFRSQATARVPSHVQHSLNRPPFGRSAEYGSRGRCRMGFLCTTTGAMLRRTQPRPSINHRRRDQAGVSHDG